MNHSTITPTLYEKTIIYDRGSYAMTLDGDLIGHAPTQRDADVTLDLVISQLMRGDARRPVRANETAECEECDGYGRVPNFHGTGEQSGGWADTCGACKGYGVVLVNWSDRPDYADPPDPGPGDGTGLGDRGEEGDDADDPTLKAWHCRACDGRHTGKGCPEITRLLYARSLTYSAKRIAHAHTHGGLMAMLCSLDRIELEAHAQALACYLIDLVAVERQRPACYVGVPEYTRLIVRRWRSMLATRPVGVVYEVMAQ
jgi:hypothetical protein